MGQADCVEQLCLFESVGVDVAELERRAGELLIAGQSARATVRTYGAAWRSFEGWCRRAGRCSLPATPETLRLYVADVGARLKCGSVQTYTWGITERHKAAGYPSPIDESVRQVLAGLARTKGSSETSKAAVTPEQLRAMVATLDCKTMQGARDAAILLLGFATGLRRANLASLDLADVKWVEGRGVLVHVRREKNDQAGKGRRIAVHYGSRAGTCPVRALERWLNHRGRAAGALFTRVDRAGGGRIAAQSIASVVQDAAAAIGLDRSEYGAHSLRAGMVTAMSAHGAADSAIMARTGHRSAAMVRRYIRHRDLFAVNPLAKAL